MTVQAPGTIPVARLRPLGDAEAEGIYSALMRSMVDLLAELSPEEWDGPTVCDLWSVRDIVAHLTGWSEALLSPRELAGQSVKAVKRRRELGNIIDAQNQVQVDDRRDLSTNELLRRFETGGLRAARLRHRIATMVGWIPFYMGYLGGRFSLDYLSNAIFPRDILVHRIDISRATGRPVQLGPSDRRVIEDMVRDWFERSKAHATLVLTGDEGPEVYVSREPPRATLTVDRVEFVRMIFQRTDAGVVEVEGDESAAAAWLSTYFPL